MYIKIHKEEIEYNIEPEQKLIKSYQKEIDNYWEELQKSKPYIFNGKGFGLKNIELSNRKLKITLVPSCYKNLIYSIDKTPTFNCYPNISVSTIFFNNGYIYLTKRGRLTGTSAGTIGHIGGMVDYSGNLSSDNLNKYLKTEIIREIKEEVVTNKPVRKSNLKFDGVHIDMNSYDSDFFYVTEDIYPVKILDDENEKIVKYKIEEIDSIKDLNPITRNFLSV